MCMSRLYAITFANKEQYFLMKSDFDKKYIDWIFCELQIQQTIFILFNNINNITIFFFSVTNNITNII